MNVIKKAAYEEAQQMFAQGANPHEVSSKVGVCYDTAVAWQRGRHRGHGNSKKAKRETRVSAKPAENGFVDVTALVDNKKWVASKETMRVQSASGCTFYGVSISMLIELRAHGFIE